MLEKVKNLIAELEQDNPGAEAVAFYQNGELLLSRHFVLDIPRLIYSHTKSYVSTLAGIAIDEGKLTLDTTLCSLFPEYDPVITDRRVKTITLRHLLTMSSGFGSAFLMGANRRKGEGMPDYLAYMLGKQLVYTPGEKFVYSNADTHLVGCMVQRAVGELLLSYAYRKLFEPMGMGFPGWETDPAGTAFGGTGLYLRNEEMMKLGVLYMQQGVWEGKRLVSPAWVKEAGRKQIDTGHPDPWHSGYGYQFWMIPQKENAFRADGAYGQFSLIFPAENAVVGIQSSESNDVNKLCAKIRWHLFGEEV